MTGTMSKGPLDDAIDALEGCIYEAEQNIEKYRARESEARQRAEIAEECKASYQAALAALKALAGKE